MVVFDMLVVELIDNALELAAGSKVWCKGFIGPIHRLPKGTVMQI